MTVPASSPLLRARARRADLIAAWTELSARSQARVKVAVLVLAVGGAYHYSLLSLLQTVGFDTPLAYVGLVPLLAGGLAWLRRHPRAGEPDIHDRQLDYIIGLPLIALAAAMDFALPGRMGAMYWVDRVDLLSLPIFVAGVTTLLFGTRVMWRQKVAIVYLLLAWPWPYTTILLGTLGGFTNLTLDGLNQVLRVVHVASQVPGAGNAGLYQVVHDGHSFPVSVVTACSGVDGMVGFFLVGAGFATLVAGPVLRKVLWLAAGLVLLWSSNLARLLVIFWLGHLAGEHLAIGEVHPVLGIVVFCLGVVAMMALLKPFGLRFADAGSPSPAPAAVRRRPAPRVYLSAAIVAVAGLVLAVNNSSLIRFDPVASAAGEPKLGSFLASPANPRGWDVSYETEYFANKPLFGESSRWFRYIYTQTTGQPGLSSSVPITADVIDASGLGGFQAYGVTDCYSFHGYTLRDVADVSLGSGISGEALSYSSSNAGDWTIVYWVWPVKTSTGVRYERVILYIQNAGSNERVVAPASVPGVAGLPHDLVSTNPGDEQLIVTRRFLVDFARQVVSLQTKKTDTDVDIATFTPSTLGLPATASTSTPAAREERREARILRREQRAQRAEAAHHSTPGDR